ncbi:MAG: WYL domain-containing protein [Mariprofundales bacterium]|nr:WYL domain-containing protein [Mariprofundales bacterium]
MSDTLMRQWQMLHMIPRHPKKIAVPTLLQQLDREGFATTVRTLQRDLNRLSVLFPLISDERNKPYGWSWQPDGDLLDIPGMDSYTALAFWMADLHLRPLLPKVTVSRLRPHFNHASHVLDAIPGRSNVSEWRNKLRVVHRGPTLMPPVIQEAVQDVVYDALLYNRCLEVTYRARNSASDKHYELNPYGLVIKDGIAYLLCTLWDYTDIKLLLLHRMQSATAMDKPAAVPEDFDLDGYIASGELDYAVGGTIRLKVMFSDHAAHHLAERPLSDDQSMHASEDGRTELVATVTDTAELRWWLLAFGERVEVLEPVEIRNYMIDTIQNMGNVYGI